LISKIIFQTGPENRERWKDIWFECETTWKNIFPDPEWKHVFWNDEDCEAFVKNEYPQYYEMYMSYDRIIQRSDIVRYLFLYKYGGIYADLDYMVIKDFYQDLPQDMVSVCESPFKGWEKVQNSLMASNPGNPFWIRVVEKAKTRTGENNVLKSTGPILLSDVVEQNIRSVNILPVKTFNPRSGTPDFNSPYIKTRHYGTCSWNYPVIPKNIKDKRMESIVSVYKEILGRFPDEGGLDFYYCSGKTINAIRRDLEGSQEHKNLRRKKDIHSLYQDWLNRVPDQEGFDFYFNSFKSIQDIKKDLASSQERRNIVKIKIISAYTRDPYFMGMSDITFPIISEYALKNGFACEKYDVTDGEREPVFMKIPLILNNLKKYDYVLWIDSDAIVINSNFDLKKLIASGRNLYISEDFNGINAGVMLWRKCEFSEKILGKIWDLYDEYKNHVWKEQEALRNLIDSNYLSAREMTEYVPQKILNAYDYSLFNMNYSKGQYDANTFILHFPSIPDRINTIKKYVDKCR